MTLSPEERERNIMANYIKYKELSDVKLNKSSEQFKDAKVVSCSHVLLGNGRAVCVAFPQIERKTAF